MEYFHERIPRKRGLVGKDKKKSIENVIFDYLLDGPKTSYEIHEYLIFCEIWISFQGLERILRYKFQKMGEIYQRGKRGPPRKYFMVKLKTYPILRVQKTNNNFKEIILEE